VHVDRQAVIVDALVAHLLAVLMGPVNLREYSHKAVLILIIVAEDS
jgi:hypothetical protein